LFQGRVVDYDAVYKLYLIRYEDGDEEELEGEHVMELLVTAETRRVPRAAPEWAVPDPSCVFALHGLDVSAAAKLHPLFDRCDCRNVANFFLFVSERQRLYERRKRGDQLLSACPVFRTYSWCNVYRELDRGTAFFRQHILKVKEQMMAERPTATFRDFVRRVLFDSYLYRQVNRIETFLEAGFPDEDNMEPFFAAIELISDRRDPVFTGAHQTTNISKLKIRIRQSTEIDPATGQCELDVVCDKFLRVNGKQKSVKELQKLRGIGDFTSWQIMCDLQESRCVEVDEETDGFCLLGPGAENGLKIIFPNSNTSELELAQQLAEKHDQVYKKLGIEFPYWRGRPLTIKEIEHALCEFAKFCSINSNGRGRSFKTQKSLDKDKACFMCHSKPEAAGVSVLCDTCKICFCFDCVKAPAKDAVSWICHRCEDFEQVDIFNISR